MLSLQFIVLSLTSILYNFPPTVHDQSPMNITFFSIHTFILSSLNFNNNFFFIREQTVFSIGL